MSNYADIELSQKLYAVSGWGGKAVSWVKDGQAIGPIHMSHPEYQVIVKKHYVCPAYDASYLLRRLPAYINHDGLKWYFTLCREISGIDWQAGYEVIHDNKLNEVIYCQTADNPEDALASLCLVLLEQEILKGVTK